MILFALTGLPIMATLNWACSNSDYQNSVTPPKEITVISLYKDVPFFNPNLNQYEDS